MLHTGLDFHCFRALPVSKYSYAFSYTFYLGPTISLEITSYAQRTFLSFGFRHVKDSSPVVSSKKDWWRYR